jgi:pimeloyl-ACP methyl ester carboxylesterase
MARLAPDRVSGMALLSTSHKADTPERSQQRAATIKMAAGKGFRGVTRHLLGSFLSAQAMADEALVARVIQMAQDVGSATFVNQQKAIMARRDQTPTLQGFAGKVLVLCGLEDTLTPPALSEDMARLVPDARLVLLPDVGHLSSLEAPQPVTDAIIDLLNEVIAARV